MNIVILDGYTTNPGDLSWELLNKFGTVTAYDQTDESDIVTRAKDAEILIMCRMPLTRETLALLPKLRLITTLATGYNTIDLKACNDFGITVSNVPLYCVQSVSQTVFSLLFELSCKTSEYNTMVKNGKWQSAVDMNYTTAPLFELSGKTFGIFGFGNIASAAAKIAAAFNMRVIYHSRTNKHNEYEYVSFDELLKQSDVLSLNSPLTDETRGIMGKNELAKMKKSAYLINTSRGAVIDEAALADALNNGIISGAGLDVMINEPPHDDNPLLTAKNCVITPHISWASREARTRLVDATTQNIAAFLNGTPQNKVN